MSIDEFTFYQRKSTRTAVFSSQSTSCTAQKPFIAAQSGRELSLINLGRSLKDASFSFWKLVFVQWYTRMQIICSGWQHIAMQSKFNWGSANFSMQQQYFISTNNSQIQTCILTCVHPDDKDTHAVCKLQYQFTAGHNSFWFYQLSQAVYFIQHAVTLNI